jgi:transposase
MMRPDANVAVFVCVSPVDMRKQAATLALIVEQALKRNIFEPALYVFSNAQRDNVTGSRSFIGSAMACVYGASGSKAETGLFSRGTLRARR